VAPPAGSGVTALGRALAGDLAPQGITVNVVRFAPAGVAELTAFLCTDAGGCITGRVIGAGRAQPAWDVRPRTA
jgi:hypothetical protein